MAASSWKSLSLLGVILLIALGLQAGAVKIMINLNQPDASVAATRAAPSAHAEAPPTAKPANIIADPPHLANPTATSTEPPHSGPSPEVHRTEPQPNPEAPHAKPQPSPEVPHANPQPSPEAQILPAISHNPMASNIPPPIELEPESPAEKSKSAIETPSAASAEAHLATATPSAEPSASATLLEPDWLKGRDSKRYTVQLYSGKDIDKLREIAGSVTGASPSAYFVTTSRSGPWYSLVVGDYADFTTAQAVATQIAAQSSMLKPWIRRFSEIQARMR